MNGMILSAGLGTRFRPHSNVLPKPAFPFLNIPLLYYSVFLAEKLGAEKVTFNTHHLPSAIENLVAEIPDPRFRTQISHEPEILGTAGCMEKARDHLDSDFFFAINADTVVIPSHDELFEEVVSYHKFEEAIATLLVMEHTEAGKKYGGVWIDDDNNVHGFGKTAPEAPVPLKPYHYIGLRVFSPEVFEFIPPGNSDIFYDALTAAIASGHVVKAFVDKAVFLDGGDLGEFLDNTRVALDLLTRSKYLQKIAKRFWPKFSKREDMLHGRAKCSLPDRVLSGHWVNIHPSVEFRGFCVLGNRVHIDEDCILEDCVVAENVTIPGRHASFARTDLISTKGTWYLWCIRFFRRPDGSRT